MRQVHAEKVVASVLGQMVWARAAESWEEQGTLQKEVSSRADKHGKEIPKESVQSILLVCIYFIKSNFNFYSLGVTQQIHQSHF